MQKKQIQQERGRKLTKAEMSRHNFKVTDGAMSQQEMIYHSKK